MKIGSEDISKLYIGSSEVTKVYLGSTLVYSGGTTPPTPTGQWVLVDDTVSNPVKIKVDYSLIDWDSDWNEIEIQYEYVDGNSGYGMSGILLPVTQYVYDELLNGWDVDVEDYIGKVVLFDLNFDILLVLEDGVEYNAAQSFGTITGAEIVSVTDTYLYAYVEE